MVAQQFWHFPSLFFNYPKIRDNYGRVHWAENVCLIFSYNICSKQFSLVFSELCSRCTCKCMLLSDFKIIGTCRQILLKFPNIKIHGNPFSGSRVVTCRRTDRSLQMHFCSFSLRNSQEGRKKEQGICNGMVAMSTLEND
jgi:hypothetical protein